MATKQTVPPHCVQAARLALGLSQPQAAAVLKMHWRTWQNWELVGGMSELLFDVFQQRTAKGKS